MSRRIQIALVTALFLPVAGWAGPGQGIGSVEVGIKKKPGGQPAGNTVTDAKGAFSLGELGPGSYILVISIPGGRKSPPLDNAKSFFESRSNIARIGGELVLQFKGWPYSVSISGAGVNGGTGTIAEVSLPAKARTAQKPVPGVRIELDVEIAGTGKTTLRGAVQASSGSTGPISR